MRKITRIILHCTATFQSDNPLKDIENIKNYWKNTLKWKSPGYHFLIDPTGKIHNIHPIEKPSNGVAGYNANSIHVCYIGGIDKNKNPLDNRTIEQKCAMLHQVKELKKKFPNATIHGHNEFSSKACPSFNVKQWLKENNL